MFFSCVRIRYNYFGCHVIIYGFMYLPTYLLGNNFFDITSNKHYQCVDTVNTFLHYFIIQKFGFLVIQKFNHLICRIYTTSWSRLLFRKVNTVFHGSCLSTFSFSSAERILTRICKVMLIEQNAENPTS